MSGSEVITTDMSGAISENISAFRSEADNKAMREAMSVPNIVFGRVAGVLAMIKAMLKANRLFGSVIDIIDMSEAILANGMFGSVDNIKAISIFNSEANNRAMREIISKMFGIYKSRPFNKARSEATSNSICMYSSETVNRTINSVSMKTINTKSALNIAKKNTDLSLRLYVKHLLQVGNHGSHSY